jgi:hypothetical protein
MYAELKFDFDGKKLMMGFQIPKSLLALSQSREMIQ